MQTGTKISAVAHVALIGWALVGGAFTSEPLPLQVQEVSVVTAEQFAAMTAAAPTPQTDTAPATLTAPEPGQTAPDVSVRPPSGPVRPAPTPDTVASSEADAPPQALPDPLPPRPEPEIGQNVPVPTPPDDLAVLTPQISPPAEASRPVDRVAPQPVAPPPPDVVPDDIQRDAVTAEESGDTPLPEQDATAPEAAVDRIITEADETADEVAALAPARSIRPPAVRPVLSEPQEPAAQPAPAAQTDNAVDAAVAEALGTPGPTAPVGPPLTSGERDALRVAVSGCWNVGSLSTDALNTTVVLAVSMQEDGRPSSSSIRLVSSSGGSEAAARQAFEAARRAIIRCGANGFGLPADKYGQWQEIEMTFNPEGMRIR